MTALYARAEEIGSSFVPMEPETMAAAGVAPSEIEALILKFLASRGDASGHQISEQVKLPFLLVLECLDRLKAAQMIAYRNSLRGSDFEYHITESGRAAARVMAERCTYFGAAPVSLDDYAAAVVAQGTADRVPSPAALAAAFEGMLVDTELLTRIGPAIASGRGMFLFGPPGNGKSTIAHRITRSLGGHIWVPRALGIDGEIVRVFDPQHHVEAPLEPHELGADQQFIDRRWVRIERPTVAVGGELTMDQLEVTANPHTGINEAPLQLKANGGTLVIDDFGRQRMSIDELLNRWIVPLEHNFDYYSLRSGRRVTLPFLQVIVFATNLEPRDLVDEAFLRRIPYKIPVVDPSPEQFRQLFELAGADLGVEVDTRVVDQMIERHYRAARRPMRFCQPRDLLTQVRNEAMFHGETPRLTLASAERAVNTYFSVI